MLKKIVIVALAGIVVAGPAAASQLVYRPTNPSFGGDPLNGNWLLSQGTAQSPGGGGTGGFVIDFPDFGGFPQPTQPTDPQPQPPVDVQQ